MHSQDEIHAIRRRDIGALADSLAGKPFFMGDNATELDAVACGFLANIVNVPIVSPVQDEARKHENLINFLDRIQRRYFAKIGAARLGRRPRFSDLQTRCSPGGV